MNVIGPRLRPSAVGLLLLVFSLEGRAAPQDFDLDAVRRAVGSWELDADVSVSGRGVAFGAETEFSLLFGREGRFRRLVEEPRRTLTIFDGQQLRIRHQQSAPFVDDGFQRELDLLWMWVLSGFWVQEKAPVLIEPVDDEGKPGEGFTLRIGLEEGRLRALLTLDSKTLLPTDMRLDAYDGTTRWRFDDYRRLHGLALAHRFVYRESSGLENAYEIGTAEKAPAFFRDPYTLLPTPIEDAHFDESVPAELDVRALPSGHLLVRPRVEEEDVGYFIFDTGAGGTVIDEGAAGELELPVCGETTLGGAGAERSVVPLYRGEAFTLGPITMEGTVYLEMGINAMFAGYGLKIGGIIGWDVLIRSVVELDMTGEKISLHDPSSYDSEGLDWRPLGLHERHPHFRASFEGDREGLFRFDSGAGRSTVTFHSPTVNSLGLLDGRDTAEAFARGAGGQMILRRGVLDWFEVAGTRYESPMVMFSQDESGAMADPYSAGNLGGRFFQGVRIVFDYSRQRVAFIKSEG